MLSKCDFISEDKVIRVLAVIDDISLMVIDGNVGQLAQELNYLRVGLSQLLWFQKFKKQQTNKKVHTIDGKGIVDLDKIESFQNKKLFYLNYFVIFSN